MGTPQGHQCAAPGLDLEDDEGWLGSTVKQQICWVDRNDVGDNKHITKSTIWWTISEVNGKVTNCLWHLWPTSHMKKSQSYICGFIPSCLPWLRQDMTEPRTAEAVHVCSHCVSSVSQGDYIDLYSIYEKMVQCLSGSSYHIYHHLFDSELDCFFFNKKILRHSMKDKTDFSHASTFWGDTSPRPQEFGFQLLAAARCLRWCDGTVPFLGRLQLWQRWFYYILFIHQGLRCVGNQMIRP